MLRESAYPQENSREGAEYEFGISKETLKQIVENRHTITDSGRSGILFRVTPEELAPEDRKKMLFNNEDNPEGLLSVKALKVFNLQKAKKEFEALQEARRIILEKMDSSDAPIFHIPKAIGFDEIDVDEETERFLNANGASITDGKVGTITMDWIEGKNLAVTLYEELLKRSLDTEGMDPNQFRDIRDFGKLLRALEKTGFVLPMEIFIQLKNGVKALHEKNLYHNDIHLGNLILKDGSLKDPQLYAIDFADATHERKAIEETEEENYLSDENIIRSLEPLTKTPKKKQEEEDRNLAKEWDERIALLGRQPKMQEQYRSLKAALETNNPDALEKEFIVSSSMDRDFENYLGTLLKISRENTEYREEIQRFLNDRRVDKRIKMRGFILKRVQELQKMIEI